jgi:large repetitive protein
VINGQGEYDQSGRSVSSAGDVNGDGLADLIVGAYRSDPTADSNAGRSYVVFGQTGTTAIDLSAIAAGSGGFVINGQCEGDFSGRSVSSAGDVNGDGLADLIVGADGSDPAAGTYAGRSYVVFGQTGTAPIDLSCGCSGQWRFCDQRPG